MRPTAIIGGSLLPVLVEVGGGARCESFQILRTEHLVRRKTEEDTEYPYGVQTHEHWSCYRNKTRTPASQFQRHLMLVAIKTETALSFLFNFLHSIFPFIMRQRRNSLALFFLSILSLGILHVDSFASWLQCFIDLDESEVIMNHMVQSADKALHLVQLEATVKGQDDAWTTESPLYIPSALSPVTVQFRLKTPAALHGQTLQYAIEATTGATFLEPSKCQGRRSHANHQDEIVELNIETSEPVEVMAAWATGHEAVTLTPKLIVTRDDGTETEELEF